VAWPTREVLLAGVGAGDVARLAGARGVSDKSILGAALRGSRE
jgi:hypothetical protein